MNRKLIAIIVLGLVLLASLLACGYFGIKTVRRTRLRRAAMTAYENREYLLAERLLHAYIQQDPNAEAEYVALANIYHEFGNAGMEVQMWQTASSLNPLNPEYREKMLDSAVKAASYPLLHSILGRKVKMGDKLTDQELYLYVIASYRADVLKDGDDAYKNAVEADPEAFHKNELGQMAEFMVSYPKLSEGKREDFLQKTTQSVDPVVRFEALYTKFSFALKNRGDENNDEVIEELLKQIVETNYFAGTPLLADYYFSKFRFSEALDILEPYLKTIDDIRLYLLYAEACVFELRLEELRALQKKLQKKGGSMQMIADYCEILIAFLENDQEKLSAAVRKSGKLINSPLSRFIRLRVALDSQSFNEIRTVAQEIFSSAAFYDLQDRALLVCLEYLSEEMKKPENRKDPSQMAELARILSGYLHGNLLLTEIILMDQYKRKLAKEEDLMAALEQFPDDVMLQRVTAEYLILNGKSEQAMTIIESILAAEKDAEEAPDSYTRFLYVLALDQLGQRDEAAAVFQELLDQSEFDAELLNEYFTYCVRNDRKEDLISMADKLDSVKDGKMGYYGKFFRAAALLADEDEAGKKEALDLLASTPTDDPEFTLYAANRLSDNGRLDEAETKYKAILKTYHTPPLILVNLSELYQDKGETEKALDAAKEAFEMEKESMLPAYIYAKRLSEAGRYEEAVDALKFPRHAVNYREEVVALWTDCMKKVIENSIRDEKYLQAEEQCRHLLAIDPDDEFGREKLEKVREILHPKKDNGTAEEGVPAA